MLGIPFSALSTWLASKVARLHQFNFTEHVVINIYYNAQVTIFSALIYTTTLALGLNYFTVSYIITALYVVYFFYILKRVFQLPFLMAFALFALTFVALGIVVVALVEKYSVAAQVATTEETFESTALEPFQLTRSEKILRRWFAPTCVLSYDNKIPFFIMRASSKLLRFKTVLES